MRISIALCTWNGAPHLPAQLASLAAQTRLPDELIVCDDASTDDTVAIVQQFAQTAPFPVELRQNPTRLGVVKNFTKAIVQCSGDLIFLCDQDDVWQRDKIAVLLRAFDNNDNLGAVFTNARLSAGTTLWDHIGFRPRERRAVNDGHAFDILVERNVVTGATMAFRDRWREAVIPIPEVSGMLHDQWIATIIAAVAQVDCVDDCLIDYRQHAAQQVGAGVAAGGIGRWVGAARGTGAREYAIHAEQLDAVLQRLERIGAPRQRIDDLRRRIAHLRTRATLPARRLSRIRIVVRELFLLRYHRYSNHFWSAAKDLFW
jgi:glycosyltransferase involved in cell wall biosynthesis